jgi:molecular chaperone GrpE
MHSKKKRDTTPTGSEEPILISDGPVALAGLPEELAAQKDDYLRLAADFDNFKKRTRRDAEQQAAAQKEAFIADLLPALDNLERALASAQATDSGALHQGVTMTLQQLGRLLQQHGIEAVEDIGRPFDPHRHEAVSVRHDSRQPDQIVLAVIQRGYCHGEQVFRPAKVIVNDLDHTPGTHDAG